MCCIWGVVCLLEFGLLQQIAFVARTFIRRVREYGRMLRTLLWSFVPLGVTGAIGAWALLIVAHVTVEAGRGQFALDLHRRSAVKAWWRGLHLVFARPLATLGSYILITAVGLILATRLGIARINSPHATFSGFLLTLALTELIAVAAIWMRIARLLALIQIARAAASFPRE